MKRKVYSVTAGSTSVLLLLVFLFQPATASQRGKSHKAAPITKSNKSRNAQIERGRRCFVANQCLDCHIVDGKGCTDGISLDGIGRRRSHAFLMKQLKDPEEHVDKFAKQFDYDPNLMPSPNLTFEEQKTVVAYLMSLKRVDDKKGERKKTQHK